MTLSYEPHRKDRETKINLGVFQYVYIWVISVYMMICWIQFIFSKISQPITNSVYCVDTINSISYDSAFRTYSSKNTSIYFHCLHRWLFNNSSRDTSLNKYFILFHLNMVAFSQYIRLLWNCNWKSYFFLYEYSDDIDYIFVTPVKPRYSTNQ